MRPRFRAQLPSLAEVRRAYDAQHGRSILRDSDRFYRAMARRILQPLGGGRRGLRVLDVGCGGGYLLRELGRSSAEVDLHGLELSVVALVEARRQAPEARLLLGQGECLPYASGRFDAVACLGNLEHFLDPGAGVRELARVCRPGGKVWVLLPNGYYSGALWQVLRTGYGPDHHQIIDRFATMNEWRDLLLEGGLVVEGIRPYNRYKWWKSLLPRSLAWHFLYRTRPAGPPTGAGVAQER
jgi:SAM-dependent methyltransferase